MLSRVANSVYWAARYLERADNICRFIYVNLHYLIDAKQSDDEVWYSLIMASGDEENFRQKYKEVSQKNVLNFLIRDLENQNSIVACVQKARDNARTCREALSEKIWQEINGLYWLTQVISKKRDLDKVLEDFLNNFQDSYLCYIGAIDLTMNRNEAWHFMRVGKLIERSDKTARILDIKYFQLSNSGLQRDENKLTDLMISKSLLKSTSGLEMFRKEYAQLTASSVAKFLLVHQDFPRSITYCLRKIHMSIKMIIDSNHNQEAGKLDQQLNIIKREVTAQQDKVIRVNPIHDFIDFFQKELNHLDTMLYEVFFCT